MNFEIVSKRDTDRFVIRDLESKGMCCCSKYTIKQLLDMGHSVDGVRLNPFTVKPIGGFTDNVPDTKRAAATIVKGIKPLKSRTAKRDVLKRVRLQRSKCVAVLQRISIDASEYNSQETYHFCLRAYTPAGLTAMKKLSKEYSKRGAGFYISDDASRILKKDGRYSVNASFVDDLLFEDKVQVVCSHCVEMRYENYYVGSGARISFRASNNFIPEFTGTHGVVTDPDVELGSCANGGSSPNGYAAYFRKCGILA